MAIYYFHIRDKLGVIEDTDGIELPDRATLLIEAIRSADEFLSEAVAVLAMRFEIVDAQGQIVLITPIRPRQAAWELLTELSLAPQQMH